MMETSHLGEGKLLQHLLQEANDSSSIEEENDHERNTSAEQQLQNMIDNYQQHVLKQKQHYQVNGNHYSSGLSSVHDHLKANGSSIDGPVRLRINKANGGSSATTPSIMSHSQPCLYVTDQQKYESDGDSYLHYPHSSDPRDQQQQHIEGGKSVNSNSVDMNALRAENSLLKQQVEILQKNTKILRSLEISYERIEREFSQMSLHRDKQEQLEQAIRFKLETQLQRLGNENELLQKQVEKLNLMVPVDPEHLVHYRLMTDLLPQNKELLAIKERQTLEIEAQNATLEEQRNHIEMLDKALSNAQERLAAKERAAVDAAALIEKCSHQQKLLQEAIDDKQKIQEESTKQRTQLEKEIAQLKLQLETAGGSRNGVWSSDAAEEIFRLRNKTQAKDERIAQLESNLSDLQQRQNEERQRNEATTRTETEALLAKIRNLEKEKREKDVKIQDLLDEKQRIHNQWADERRTLDRHVRILEQNIRQNDGRLNGFYSSNQPNTASVEGQIGRPAMARAAMLYGPNIHQMEDDIRQKIAERQAASAHSSNWMNRVLKPGGSQSHTRSVSGSALTEYSSINSNATISTHPPTNTAIVSLVNPVGHHSSASSADSTTNSSDSVSPSGVHPTTSMSNYSSTTTVNTSSNVQFSAPARSPNRMASKMPTSNLSSYIESLPAATRRRITDQNLNKRTAVALGSGFKRSAWNSSSNETSTQQRSIDTSDTATTNVSTTSSDAGEVHSNHPNMTTVVEVNNLRDNNNKYRKA